MTDQQFDPDASVPVDDIQLGSFDPEQYIAQKNSQKYEAEQSQYGSPLQSVLAAGAGAARAGTLGLSDVALTKSGLVNPETLTNLAEANPTSTFGGELVGGALGIASGIGEAAGAGLAARGLGKTAAHFTGMALEGGAFGLGNAVSDYGLGDTNLNAQKILADIGIGGIIGTGLAGLGKAIQASPALFRKMKPSPEAVAAATESGAAGAEESLLGKKPGSFEEQKQMTEDLIKHGGADVSLPGRDAAEQASQRLADKMRLPITDHQLESLTHSDKRLRYKTDAETPGDIGTVLRNTATIQKQDLTHILDQSIQAIDPEASPISNAYKAGEELSEDLKSEILKQEAEAGPVLENVKAHMENSGQDVDHLPGVISYLTDPAMSPRANPNIAKMFDISDPDKLAFKPWDSGWGIAKSAYQKLKKGLEDISTEPNNFEKIDNIRKDLTEGVNVLEGQGAPQQLTQAKAAIMDYIQDVVQKEVPDVQVRDAYMKWAKIQEAKEYIESHFGAELKGWRTKAGDVPYEKILDNVFRNSALTENAMEILPKDKMSKALSNYMAVLRKEATQDGAFSARKFTNFIKNDSSLEQAFQLHPEKFNTINDALTVMRQFTDDIPANPSGTTKTWYQKLFSAGVDPVKVAHQIGDLIKEKASETNRIREINAKMGGISDQAARLSTLNNAIQKVTQKINSAAKAVLGSNKTRGALIAGSTYLSDAEYDRITKQVHELTSDPEKMMEHFASNTDDLYGVAPAITQSLHNAATRAIQFLASKIPMPVGQFPLSSKWSPTASQKANFAQYYAAVQEPLSAYAQIKSGSLSNHTMEALQIVHPELLAEMRQTLISHMKMDEMRKLPYAEKLGFAKFLNQPLDGNMTPQAIMANQMSFHAPQLSQQNTAKTGQKVGLGGMKQLNLASRSGAASRRDPDDK